MSIQIEDKEICDSKTLDSLSQLSNQKLTNCKKSIRQSKLVKLNKHRRTVYSRQEGILIEKPAFIPMCFKNIDLQLIRRPGKFLSEFKTEERTNQNILKQSINNSNSNKKSSDAIGGTGLSKVLLKPGSHQLSARWKKSFVPNKSSFCKIQNNINHQLQEFKQKRISIKCSILYFLVDYLKTNRMFVTALLKTAYKVLDVYLNNDSFEYSTNAKIFVSEDHIKNLESILKVEQEVHSFGSCYEQSRKINCMDKNKKLHIEKNILSSIIHLKMKECKKNPIDKSNNFLLPPVSYQDLDTHSEIGSPAVKLSRRHLSQTKQCRSFNRNLFDTNSCLLTAKDNGSKRFDNFVRPISVGRFKKLEVENIKNLKNPFRDKLGKSRNPSHFDLNLVSESCHTQTHNSKSIFEFIGKTREQLKAEKVARNKKLASCSNDVSTVLFKSLGQKIERFGKKILVCSKGQTNKKR